MLSVLLFFIALIMGIVFTWLIRFVALRYNIVNYPNKIVPQHVKPVAYLGGLAIYLTIVVTIGAFIFTYPKGNPQIPALIRHLLLPSILFLLIGLIDDLHPLSAKRKFILQGISAAIAIWTGNVCSFFTNPFINATISFLWILVLVNALNLTDVCDGLVTGLATISFIFLGLIFACQSTLAFIFAGASVGFLVFNFPSASIFLGDAGSHLLGFLIGGLMLSTRENTGLWPYLPIVGLIVSVPIFELAFLVIVRTNKGLPWWKGSSDHFSLRLQAAGLSKLQTDFLAWSIAIMACLAAVILPNINVILQVLIIVVIFSFFMACGLVLLQWEV